MCRAAAAGRIPAPPPSAESLSAAAISANDAAGFDLIWFGVFMAVVIGMGLIHPPVGLNIFAINGIAPDIGPGAVIRRTSPFVVLMAIGVVIQSAFPEIALRLSTLVYG
jgi:TRAP-type C4-dicarboxylate transport system permease large subunit